MIEKYYYLDRKYTIWERQHLVLKKETQEEIDKYIENVHLNEINYYLGKEGYFDEIDTELLYDSMEELPLEKNEGCCTLTLLDEDYNAVTSNFNKLHRKYLKSFSVSDIEFIWKQLYGENLSEDYAGFFDELLKRVK